MFDVLRGMSEKLSSCHMDVVHKFHDIVKDLGKYLEEQKGKHKQVFDKSFNNFRKYVNILVFFIKQDGLSFAVLVFRLFSVVYPKTQLKFPS